MLDGLHEITGVRVARIFSTNNLTYRLILHQADDELSVIVPPTIEIDFRRLRRSPRDLKWRSHVFVDSRDNYHAPGLEWITSFCSLGISRFLSSERWASACDCRPRLPYIQGVKLRGDCGLRLARGRISGPSRVGGRSPRSLRYAAGAAQRGKIPSHQEREMRVAMGEPELGGSTRDRLPRHRRKLLRASSSMTWDPVDAALRRLAWRDASA